MAVVADAEVHDVESPLGAGDGVDLLAVGGGRRLQVGLLDRHGMHVGRRDRHPIEQRLRQAHHVAVAVTGRRHPLVDLEDVHRLPAQLAAGQLGQERGRSTAAADRQCRPAPGLDRLGQLGGDQIGRPPGQGGAVRAGPQPRCRSPGHHCPAPDPSMPSAAVSVDPDLTVPGLSGPFREDFCLPSRMWRGGRHPSPV